MSSPMCSAMMTLLVVAVAAEWTTQPRSEHPSGAPERTTSPQRAFELAKRDGGAVESVDLLPEPGIVEGGGFPSAETSLAMFKCL